MSNGNRALDSSQSPPVVSVILLTYNHERFIEEALRSVLMQKDSPTHEIHVAEDCSPDRTREILAKLSKEFPGRFEVLKREKNLGLSANLEDAWTRTRGKYIVILEGDDYWNDPYKLAKVTAAMESHPEWVGCFHSCKTQNEMKRRFPDLVPCDLRRQVVTFDELIRVPIIPTYSCTTYRKGIVDQFPIEHRGLASGDWILQLLHTEHGDIGFLPEAMTVYRIHQHGMASGMTEFGRLHDTITAHDRAYRLFASRHPEAVAVMRAQLLLRHEQAFEDLKKIDRRYHALQLHRFAAVGKLIRSFFRRSSNGNGSASS